MSISIDEVVDSSVIDGLTIPCVRVKFEDCQNPAKLVLEGKCLACAGAGYSGPHHFMFCCEPCWVLRQFKVVTCRCGDVAFVSDFWKVVDVL